VLLDDILSALDVHTAKWIVDQCLAGDLVRGRTVLLVTHNVQLAKRVADYLVLLRLDGTIDSRGPVEDVVRHDKSLREAIAVAEGLDEVEKEAETAEPEDKKKAAAGKLIIDEEMAFGHVGWPACKLCSLHCSGYSLRDWEYRSIVLR